MKRFVIPVLLILCLPALAEDKTAAAPPKKTCGDTVKDCQKFADDLQHTNDNLTALVAQAQQRANNYRALLIKQQDSIASGQ